MLFNSVEFVFVLLPATLAAYYVLRGTFGHWAGVAVLNIASLVFYAWWDVRYTPLLIGSAVFNWALGQALAAGRRGGLLTLGVVANLALLGVFKYADFTLSTVNAVSGADLALTHIALPLAISFFTFQQIAFLVDIAGGRTKPSPFFQHLLFVAFFPQLVAGPIVAHRLMGPQLADAARKDDIVDNLGVGLSIFAIGLAKKVLLAEGVEPFASAPFEAAARGVSLGFAEAWTGALAYGLQIYFDFSGYSDMALGLARCFGYHLPINFNAPYRSASIIAFWRRWHITLSQFLRDYLYIPLGGNRHGEPRRLANLMIVMLLGGLWHGAAWTFVVWGALHGGALVVAHLFERVAPWAKRPALIPAWTLLTFVFVTIAWVFFRADSFAAAHAMLTAMTGFTGFMGGVEDAALGYIAVGLIVVWGLPDTAQAFARALNPDTLRTAGVTPARRFVWRPGLLGGALAGVIVFLSVINAWKTSEFIYYTF